MRHLLILMALLSMQGCAYLEEKAARQSDHNGTDKPLSPHAQNALSAYKSQSVHADNAQNMVHIVRKGNGTTIEFWIDLYNDDVKIDYEFDDSEVLEEKVELLETKFIDSIESTKAKAQAKANEEALHQFLGLYEKSQQLVYAKKFTEALDTINNALALSPKAVQGMKLKGSILYKMNDKVGARRMWEEVLILDPYADDVRASLRELEKGSK
ncbi:MAG: hypothetical protein KU37_07625 [Sulfuricurvum sp. PC08-66]|nr:MAG: hypothetical protein KU37_07625 [Sulfuricurvum sp. PC08-66]